MAELTRRNFVAGVGAAAASAALMAGVVKADAEELATMPWDYETDILVVGLGGCGAAAAITALDEELGDVLVIEAAPQEYEGGNTRCSKQVIFSGNDLEGLITYQTSLNQGYTMSDEVMRAWAEGIMDNIEWLEDLGLNPEPTKSFSPEFAEAECGDAVQCYLNDGTIDNQSLWQPLREVLGEYEPTILYDTRVVALIQDPQTQEVRGAVTEKGERIKARKGILLACGGYEFDDELMADNYPVGLHRCVGMGTPYNRGDGVRMAAQAGARLWHMNNYSTIGLCIQLPFNGEPGAASMITPEADFKDWIVVGPDGRRFMYEETHNLLKHGKFNYDGCYVHTRDVYPMYVVMGANGFANFDILHGGTSMFNNQHDLTMTNAQLLENGVAVEGATIEELAEKIGLNPSSLAETIASYNENAAAGVDPEFGRGADFYANFSLSETNEITSGTEKIPSVKAFELQTLEPPFYAVPVYRSAANTQGGPEHGPSYNVVRPDGSSIGRLYAGGECGSSYPYMYNGGGNVAEALSSGRIAARAIAALEPWE